jgi:hypothetical protein
MLSAAARPRCSDSFTPVRRFKGWRSMSMAVTKETKPPTVVSLAADCPATMEMTKASAMAASSCTSEVLPAEAAAYFMEKLRTRLAAR